MMKIWKKMTVRWKIDFLIDCNILLLILFLLLLFKFLGVSISPFLPIIPPIIVFPNLFRRRRMFKEVALIMELLDIPLSELRMVLKAGSYDMLEWDEKKTIITLSKLYQAVAYMEDQYFLTFHEHYNKEAATKKLAEKKAVAKSSLATYN